MIAQEGLASRAMIRGTMQGFDNARAMLDKLEWVDLGGNYFSREGGEQRFTIVEAMTVVLLEVQEAIDLMTGAESKPCACAEPPGGLVAAADKPDGYVYHVASLGALEARVATQGVAIAVLENQTARLLAVQDKILKWGDGFPGQSNGR